MSSSDYYTNDPGDTAASAPPGEYSTTTSTNPQYSSTGKAATSTTKNADVGGFTPGWWRTWGMFLALLSAVIASLSNIYIRKAHLFSASDATLLRYILTFFVMIIVAKAKGLSMFGEKGQRWLLAGRGFAGAMALIGLAFAVKLLHPSDAFAIFHLNVLFVLFLARMLLGERIPYAHIFSVIMILTGIVLIVQPPYLIPDEWRDDTTAPTTAFSFDPNSLYKRSRTLSIVGICMAIFGALSSAFGHIFLKRLTNRRIDTSVILLYVAYFGIPISFLISLGLYLMGYEKIPKWSNTIAYSRTHLYWQIFYLVLSAVLGLIQTVLFNLSSYYEETSKMALIRSTDLLWTFLFQWLILNIVPSSMHTTGALLIFAGAMLIMVFKIIEVNYTRLGDTSRSSATTSGASELGGGGTMGERANAFTRFLNYKF